jgi:hypothetical protein
VFNTQSSTLLGLGWGILATWWVGVLIGIPLAFAARAGRRPKREPLSLCRAIALLMIVMACGATLAGVVGYLLARSRVVVLLEPLASRVPPEKHVSFIADLWSHSASYLVGAIGGIVLIVSTWRSRSIIARQDQ